MTAMNESSVMARMRSIPPALLIAMTTAAMESDAQAQLISRLELTEHNQDKLLIDAKCGPVEVRHPTDFSLLNEA